MRVSASLGLVMLLALFTTCEQRNFDRCLTTGTDFQCETGKFCKPIANDPSGLSDIGMCVASECTPSMNPSGCAPEKPICSAQGRCVECDDDTLTHCSALYSALPYCVSGKCVACSAATNSGCESDPLHPACDSDTNTCRACTKHSECPSKACVKDNTLSGLPSGKALSMGMCVPKSRVLVVDQSTCPTCTVQTQVDKASVDFPYVLLNNFTPTTSGQVIVKPIAGLPELHIITATADSSPSKLTAATAIGFSYKTAGVGALTVSQGASVTVEGLVILNSKLGVLCDSVSGGVSALTSVKLLRTLISNSDLAIQTKAKCQLTLDQSWIGWGPQGLGGGNFASLVLDSTQFDIINSIFLHNYNTGAFGGLTITDNGSLSPVGHIVNSTFYIHPNPGTNNALAVSCPNGVAKTPFTVFNTLFVNANGATPAANQPYVDPNCRSATSLGYVASDDSPAPTGQGVVSGVSDSMFTGTASTGYDLHLKASAPASVVSGGVLTFNNVTAPTVDMEGNPRSKTSPTIGAFEVTH